MDIEPEMLANTGEKAKALGVKKIELLELDFVADGCGLADTPSD